MTIRSMPPASSHLAESPVPARPPARARASDQRAERGDNRRREFGIVDVALQSDELPVAGLAYRPIERAEQRGVGFGIPEGLPRRVERGDAAFRQKEPHRPVHRVEALADPAADAFVLFGGRAHQRDLRIVNVQLAATVALGNGVGRSEIDHVERADRADVRDAGANDGAETILGRREHAAHQQIADFRGRDVDHPRQETGIDQLLHRAAADAGGMEDEARVFAARASSRAFTMPTSALAPLASTWREIEFSPCTSVTEYTMVISACPT